MPRSRARAVALALVAMLVVLASWGASRLRVVGDVRHFIPTSDERELSEIAHALAGSALARTLVVMLEGPDAVPVARALAEQLSDHPEVQWVRTGVDDRMRRDVIEIYGPRRYAMDDREWNDQTLQAAAAALRRDLAGPKGTLVGRQAARDPLASFAALLDRMRADDVDTLAVRDGVFVTNDGAAVVFVRTHASPFDTAAQARLQADMSTLVAAIPHAVPLTVRQSGLAPFGVASERTSVADVTRVTIASAIGIVVLFIVLFRSVFVAVLVAIPVVLGVGGGILACSLFVPHVHGLTLAFGAALLGVGVDYAVHLVFHLHLAGDRSPRQVLARVRPALLLGAGTTLAGLCGLSLSSFPGMRELALFGAVGVAASVVVTLVVVPAFAPRRASTRTIIRLVGMCARWRDHIARRARGARIALAAVLVVAAIGATQVSWREGLTALFEPDPTVLAESEYVRAATGGVDQSRVVLARGPDLQSALCRNDEVYRALSTARDDGAIAGFRSLSPWLPSFATQRERLRRLSDPELHRQIRETFAAMGFRKQAFDPFYTAVASAPAPLGRGELAGTSLAPIVDGFILDLEDGVAVATWVRGPIPDELADTLTMIPDVVVFDQRAFIDGAYARLRTQMLRLFALGLFAVVAVIALRYRAFRPTLAASIPAFAAVLGALGAVGLFGGPGNLVHVAALLLVASIGADYGVFMVEHRRRHDAAITLAAAFVAAITTVLSFGLLAMSDNAALASVGHAIVVGVICAWLSAPIAATLDTQAR